jgi:pimeloyl-ACP methyl ester carboxylesterase
VKVQAIAAAVLLALGATLTGAQAGHAEAATPIYFIHGYNHGESSDCADLWGDALDYFAGNGHGPLQTVGYYEGDTNCDAKVIDGDRDTRIKHVAAAFANYVYDHHTSKGESIEIVAHSMGGLVARVALLGSAKGWDGFPKGKLKVDDVVTLATPHKGITDPGKYESKQWKSMVWGSEFMKVLHAKENRLSESWAAGTDWSFVGSDEDGTVSADSAIDKDFHADHKYRYLPDKDHDISHTAIRTLVPGGGDYNLRYWHASEGTPHDTTKGWAPVETADNALARNDDW